MIELQLSISGSLALIPFTILTRTNMTADIHDYSAYNNKPVIVASC